MLKRKRSASELGSPPGHAILDVSRRASYQPPASHLPSRTLKRFRDSRPSDDQVHQHTLDLLYSAQRRPELHRRGPLPVSESSLNPDPSSALADQQTLHRFWTIDSAPTSTGSSPASNRPLPAESSSSCPDCGASLTEDGGGGGGGDSMDLDGFPFHSANTACGACGKHVCLGYSVSSLAEDGQCLQCAGRGVWIGGIGWTRNGASAC